MSPSIVRCRDEENVMPKGYVYAEVDITDLEQYGKYRELAS